MNEARVAIGTPGRSLDLARTAATAALALVPLMHLAIVLPGVWDAAERPLDVVAYVSAAERIRAGELLYQPVPPGPHVPSVGSPYLYPPFLASALALLPLSQVGLTRFALLAGLACFWLYAACLARIAAGAFTLRGTLVWGAVLTAGVFSLGALYVGQIDSLIWALFGVALVFPAWRGFGLAASAMLKPFAVWPLALALWRERRPAAIGTGVALALALATAGLALGPAGFVQACRTWFAEIYPSLSQGQFSYGAPASPPTTVGGHVLAYIGNGNFSLSFLPLQFANAFGWTFPGPDLPVWARIYLTFAGVAAPVLVLYGTRRAGPELRYAAVMGAAVVFSPIFRATYSPILFSIVAAWIAERRRREHGP